MTRDSDRLMVEHAAKALWDWEHEGRRNMVLDVEWSLLAPDYYKRALVVINAANSYKESV